MKLRIALFILAVAIMAAFGLFTQANAGCVGAAIGEGCIGIPTPREHHEHPYRYEDHDRDAVVVHRHRHAPPVILHDHDEDED